MSRVLFLFVLLIAIVAMLAPAGVGHTDDTVLVALGMVVLTIQATILSSVARRSDAQPVPLLALRLFRAPPSSRAF